MGDERRNDGSGTVVAIVLILGILVLLGVLVLVGGAFFFVARTADVQVLQATAVQPAPTAAATPPLTADLAPAELPDLKVDAEGKVFLAGEVIPQDELKAKLTEWKQANPEMFLPLKIDSSDAASTAGQELQALLKELMIGFEIQP